LAAVLSAGCGPRQVEQTDIVAITLETADGYAVRASLYRVSNPNTPGLIFVHMLGASRQDWDAFARRAQREGIMSIAFDMRGHGESTKRGNDRVSYRSFAPADWSNVVQDVSAAKKALLEAGADPENIAAVGASIGANLALTYAAGDEQIQALVLLSPGIEYHGVKALTAIDAYGNRPILLMTATGDAYSAQSCIALRAAARGQCEIREYDGGAHGTDLLDSHTQCGEQILLWLRPIIGTSTGERVQTP
jgi:dienelactone hydrolase